MAWVAGAWIDGSMSYQWAESPFWLRSCYCGRRPRIVTLRHLGRSISHFVVCRPRIPSPNRSPCALGVGRLVARRAGVSRMQSYVRYAFSVLVSLNNSTNLVPGLLHSSQSPMVVSVAPPRSCDHGMAHRPEGCEFTCHSDSFQGDSCG